MQIEPATLEDCRAIAEVHVLSWQHAYQDILPAEYLASLSIDEGEAIWRRSVENGKPQLLVARSSNHVVGFIAFGASRDRDAKPDRGEIWALYVTPSAWSTGVGRLLWLTSLERMLAEGFQSVSLWVLADNDRAIEFYLNAGCKPEPQSVQQFMLGGTTLQEIRYIFSDD